MFDQMTLPGIDNATSSPGSAAGRSPRDLQDGQKIENSGQAPRRASRSRSQARGSELLMRGTYGPTYSASSVPDGPLASLESKLRQRLARIGSSECDLTWKVQAMSDGGLLSRLVPSTPRIVEIDSGLLLAAAAHWVTPSARDWKDTPGMNTVRPDGRSRIDQLPRQVAAAYWSTPRATDGTKGGPNQSFGAGGQPLPAQAFHAAMYPTPSACGFEAVDAKKLMERRDRCKESTGNGNGFGLTLGQFACLESAMWPTTTVTDANRGSGTIRPHDTGIPLPQRVAQITGTELDGSSVTTAKRGVLNPAFPCWLMGYPIEHLCSGVTAMQSFPRLRRKS